MLVGKINTLKSVNFLNFADEIILNSIDFLDLKKIVRINTTFGKFISGFNLVAFLNFDS